MKKILASILVLTMLVCCMSISAFAEGAPATITISDATVEAGKVARFDVNVEVSGKFAAVSLDFVIDPALEGAYISYVEQGMWTLNNGSIQANEENGMMVWYNAKNCDLDRKATGTMCTYEITVPADAVNGEYTMTLNCVDYCYVANVDGEEVVTSIKGVTTSDTATLTVTGGKEPGTIDPPHEHAAGAEVLFDAENHWNVCECGEKVNVAAHAYDNDQDAECNVCKAVRDVEIPHEHAAGTAVLYDANGHWNVCECGEKVNVAAHAYDDDADATCNGCEYTREITPPAHGDDDHEYEDEWKSDEDNHWKECEADGQTGDVGAHEYDDEADTECNVCGYKRTIAGGEEDDGEDDGKDDGKEEDKEDNKDDTTETGDSTNLFIYMAICLFAAAAIVVTSYKLKKSRG